MSSSKDGKDYEQLVEFVYKELCRDERFTKVERDQKLSSPDGLRQIDVLLTHTHAHTEYRTVIECRDYSRRLNVTHVDAFASKMSDVKANKGIIVSRNGFSKTAIQKAKRLGIGLCQVDSAPSLLASMSLEIPIIAVQIEIIINIEAFTYNEQPRDTKIPKDALSTVNDLRIRDLVFADINVGKIPIPLQKTVMKYEPQSISPPYYVRDRDHNKISILEFSIEVTLEPTLFAGTSSKLPDVLVHSSLEKQSVVLLIPSRFRVETTEKFARYKSISDVPATFNSALISILIPDKWEEEWKSGEVNL